MKATSPGCTCLCSSASLSTSSIMCVIVCEGGGVCVGEEKGGWKQEGATTRRGDKTAGGSQHAVEGVHLRGHFLSIQDVL